jgi:ribosomal protein L19E
MNNNQMRIRELHQQIETLRDENRLTAEAFETIFNEAKSLVDAPRRLEAFFVRAPVEWINAQKPALQHA